MYASHVRMHIKIQNCVRLTETQKVVVPFWRRFFLGSFELTSLLARPPGSSSDVATEVAGVLVRSSRPSSGRSFSALVPEAVRLGFALAVVAPQSWCDKLSKSGLDVPTRIVVAAPAPPPRPSSSPIPPDFSAGSEVKASRTRPSRKPGRKPQLPAAGSGIERQPLTLSRPNESNESEPAPGRETSPVLW